MRLFKFIGIFAVTLLAACDQTGGADMVIRGGPIYTADDAAPRAESVVVDDGKIVYVGDEAGAAELLGAGTQVIDLEGRTMVPGLADAHVHLMGVGDREMSLDLKAVGSIGALQTTLTAWIKAHPDERVIIGRGWIETHWPEKRFPTRLDIDGVTGAVPTILTRADGHALLANSAALKAARITGTTEVPFGGDIVKLDDGTPSGILIDAAQRLILSLAPEPTLERQSEALAKGLDLYASRGWVHAHNMSVAPGEAALLEGLADKGDMPLKIYNSVDGRSAATFLKRPVELNGKGLVRTRALKLYMDGALGSRGAALLAPYADHEGSGLLMVTEEEVMPLLVAALRKGLQVNTHAIGDRGNRLTLDWYEKAFAAVSEDERAIAEPRWRIEHSQILHIDDIKRFAALGVIASMQPSHAIGDLHFAPARLGEGRLKGAYAWRSLIDAGAIIAAGSDAPVEEGDPMVEFYAAVARRDLKGFAGENWHSEERVTRNEALKMMTLWPAFAAFQETETGSISLGKAADFTVLSGDIMTLPEDEIPAVKAVMTVVNGRIVFDGR